MALTIEDLADSILLDIFELLDTKSLKESMLVCKRWHDVIGTSPVTMKRFHLTMVNSFINDFIDPREVLESSKNFVRITFRPQHIAREYYQLCEHSAEYLQELELETMPLSVEWISGLLKNLKVIKSLTLLEDSEEFEPYLEEPVQLTSLSYLSIYGKNSRILQTIAAPNIVKFVCSGDPDTEILAKFLLQAPKLKSFLCKQKLFLDTFNLVKERGQRFPFKLKTFRRFFADEEVDQSLRFSELLLSQASSLEKLELSCFSSEDFLTILTKLKKLKVWDRPELNQLPNDEQFYAQLRPTAIKEIIGNRSTFPNKVAAQGVIGNCPNLEKIYLPGDMNFTNMWMFMSNYNRKLKSISVMFEGNDWSNAFFPQLESLDVGFLTAPGPLKSFLQRNQTIEQFSADNVYGLDGWNFFNQYNLKEIRLGGCQEEMKKIFDQINPDPRSVEYLQLSIKIQGSGTSMILTYEYPTDPAKWGYLKKTSLKLHEIFKQRLIAKKEFEQRYIIGEGEDDSV